MKKIWVPFILVSIIFTVRVDAQRLMGLSRYDDNFRALAEDSLHKFTVTPFLKARYLDAGRHSFIGFGGEVREEGEYVNNESWGSLAPGERKNNNGKPYLLQRYMFHTDIQLSRYFRLFGELKSGLENGRNTGPRPYIDEDKLDIHQAFAGY